MDMNANIPEPLQDALVRAIQDICILIHMQKECAGVKVEISHVSDAIQKTAVSSVRVAVAGVGTFVLKPEGGLTGDPKKMAEDMLKDVLKKKENGEGE